MWDEGLEKWYFSITDIIEVLVQTDRPRKYWNDLKTKLRQEGSELSEKIGQLKLELVLNMLAEVSTTEISQKEEPNTFERNRKVARRVVELHELPNKK